MDQEWLDEYAEHPEEYERECLDLIRSYYQRPGNQEGMMTYAGRVFLEAHLEDSYPYTLLVVLYRYLNEASPRRVAFPLWSDEWVYEASGKKWRDSPLHLIDIITANLDEPGDPDY
jgi:hypothetical protein